MYDAEYQRAYREAHREEMRAYKKRYREEQHEKVAAGQHRCYVRRREEIIAKTRKWYEENREAGRETRKAYAKAHPEIMAEGVRRWRAKNPLGAGAHQAVQRALKVGRLVRPDECEECHAPAFTEAHHEDYAKPLDVDWLCKPCHTARTRGTLFS